jgi:hypothetical protein
MSPQRRSAAGTSIRSRPPSKGSNQTTTLALVRVGLTATLDPGVVDQALATYEELKRNFYLGGNRLSAVEAGRFCEAVVRILQQSASGNFTALVDNLEVDKELRRLENQVTAPESVRLHIPRAIRVIYTIRNKRNNAHLNDGIDANIQDSTLVAATCDWIMAELVRLHHNVPPAEATSIVHDLVQRKAPLVQDFDGYLKVLDPTLPAGDHLLLLLYQQGSGGASTEQLRDWARPDMRRNLKRTIARLVYDKAWAHEDTGKYFITEAGINEVNCRKLHP